MKSFTPGTKRWTAILLLLTLFLQLLPPFHASATTSLEKSKLLPLESTLSDEYHNAINFLCNNGFADDFTYGGYDPFEPDALIWRSELICVLYRMANAQEGQYDNPFSDVQEAIWYCDAVKWGVYTGIIKETEDGLFGPNECVTHGELLTYLWEYCKWYFSLHEGTLYYDESFSVDTYYSDIDYDKEYVH